MNCILDAIALYFVSNNESKSEQAHDRFMFLIHCRVTKAQVSLRKLCADSPEPSILAYTKYGYR